MEDNWKHRSDYMKCRTCMWFVEKQRKPSRGQIVSITTTDKEKIEAELKKPGGFQVDDEIQIKEVPKLGRCRKNAPTMSGFPAVFVDDWCGNHKLDEEKI